MKYIAEKTEDGAIKEKLSIYCRVLEVSRQAFYEYLVNRDKPYKYKKIADKIRKIIDEDKCNDTYGSRRIHAALKLQETEDVHIPSVPYTV